MRSVNAESKLSLAIIGLALLVSPLSGCTVLGPRTIRTGRIDYNQAINYTEGQQLLLNVLRSRYGEITTSLAVSGIAANAKVHTAAGIEAGFANNATYAGNLVPRHKSRGGGSEKQNEGGFSSVFVKLASRHSPSPLTDWTTTAGSETAGTTPSKCPS
jgi:hypothetical protein